MLKEVRGGRNIYGAIIGIILQERTFPRIPGDMGNASTFDFPVRLHLLKGIDSSTRWRIFNGDEELLEPFIDAARQLEREGVRAITSTCGFLIQYQDIIANAVSVPVFMSSLLQIPLVYRMLRKDQIIGVITANAGQRGLGKRHFQAAGAGDIPIATIGMEGSKGFEAIIPVMDDSLPPGQDNEVLYPEQLRDDIVERAEKLVRENPNVGAIVLECANLPPYAKAIQDAVNLPVFDFVTLTNFVYSAIVRREFTGFI
jgi:hypothetical protein